MNDFLISVLFIMILYVRVSNKNYRKIIQYIFAYVYLVPITAHHKEINDENRIK